MGISEQDQTYIFERYRKAKSATKENFGAGLGLAIVKKILDIHDASIKVISKPNQGAAFQFALPVYSG
jgi:signal transduction histidine kinase